jgi:hypothetical protein
MSTTKKQAAKPKKRPHLVEIDDALYQQIDAMRKAQVVGVPTMPATINALLLRGYELTKGEA